MTLGIPQRDSEHYSKLQIPKHIFWKNTIILNKWRWFQIIEFYSEVTPEHCHIPNIFVCLKTSEVVWRIPNMSNFGMRCNTGSRRTYLHMYRGTWFLYKSHLTFRRLKKRTMTVQTQNAISRFIQRCCMKTIHGWKVITWTISPCDQPETAIERFLTWGWQFIAIILRCSNYDLWTFLLPQS